MSVVVLLVVSGGILGVCFVISALLLTSGGALERGCCAIMDGKKNATQNENRIGFISPIVSRSADCESPNRAEVVPSAGRCPSNQCNLTLTQTMLIRIVNSRLFRVISCFGH